MKESCVEAETCISPGPFSLGLLLSLLSSLPLQQCILCIAGTYLLLTYFNDFTLHLETTLNVLPPNSQTVSILQTSQTLFLSALQLCPLCSLNMGAPLSTRTHVPALHSPRLLPVLVLQVSASGRGSATHHITLIISSAVGTKHTASAWARGPHPCLKL